MPYFVSSHLLLLLHLYMATSPTLIDLIHTFPVAAEKALPKGKKKERAVKKAQKTPCSRACPSQKKKHRGEEEILHAGGHGGQCRSTEADAVVPDPAPRDRSTHGHMSEAGYDTEVFDAFCVFVGDCEDASRTTTNADIKAEATDVARAAAQQFVM